MGQAYVSMGGPLNHSEEEGILGAKFVANLPNTSYWSSGRVQFVDPGVSTGVPADGQGIYWPGMRQEPLFIRVDAGDNPAALAAKVRTEVNAIATSLGITIPANQILITTYSRI